MAKKPTYSMLEKRLQELERENSEYKQAEQWKILNIKIMELINKSEVWKDCIEEVLNEIKQFTGLEAVAIRLIEGEDFPYYVTKGFPVRFVEAENYLCTRGSKGELIRDSNGNPCVECMCGNVICGRTDNSKHFFTEGGSFWSNNTSKLLSVTTDEDRQTRTRNRCNSEGYESVGLFPLKAGNEIFGLLQLNDKRPHQFTEVTINFFEEIGLNIGSAFSMQQGREKLKISEKKYRMLFKNMAHGVIYQNAEGKIFDYNQNAFDMLGLTRDQLLGRISLDPQWKVIQEDGSDFPGDKHPSMVALKTGEQVRDVIAGVFNPRKKKFYG